MKRCRTARGFPVLLIAVWALSAVTLAASSSDSLNTSAGPLEISLPGHGSLMFGFQGQTFYVDPWSKMADYAALPEADLVLLTHDHGDHLDPAALRSVTTARTTLVMTERCAEKVADLPGVKTIMKNGEVRTVGGLRIEAVPAYNLVHMRSSGEPYHPNGAGNGYVVTFGDKRVYVAGDTENTPEMKALKDIDVAFLPMNLPYTMTSAMAADAAKAFKPGIVYPYHTRFSSEDQVPGFIERMKGVPEVEIRWPR